jgi:hypothetical protein
MTINLSAIAMMSVRVETDKRSIWKCKDKKEQRAYIYHSSEINGTTEDISLVTVDGRRNSRPQRRCDFLLIRENFSICYFIELKGSDLEHAASQLLETMQSFSTCVEESTVNARVVLSKVRTPDLRSTTIQKVRLYCKKKNNGNFVYKTSLLKENNQGIFD